LKVAWFTPVTGDDPVVDFSRSVLTAMAELCDSFLCCNCQPEGFPAGVPVVDCAGRPETLPHWDSLDAMFYVLGSDVEQHAWIFETARVYGGIVVLCERTLHRFFLDYYLQYLRRPELYVTRMAEHYGLAGLRAAQEILKPWFEYRNVRLSEVDLFRFSFTEEALRAARGAVVHSGWHARSVRHLWNGPLCETQLPAKRGSATPGPAGLTDGEFDDSRTTLVTFGPVEPDNHIARVVEILAGDRDLADHVRYVIVGRCDPSEPAVQGLQAIVAEHGLERAVRLLGVVPPETRERWAHAADVLVSLHHPNTEGCPASIMNQLSLAKPVLVYDTLSVADIPPQAIARVGFGDRAGLHAVLRELVESPERREVIGSAGSCFAAESSATTYAQAILRFVQKQSPRAEYVVEAQSRAVAKRFATHIGKTLGSLGAAPGSPGVDAVIAESTRLLAPPA
jgi:glycosyltransferase involved in cell wall biosynthesis